MKKYFLLLHILLLTATVTFAQTIPNSEAIIGFYNLENLFDTADDPKTDDKEFLPDGTNQWTPERYQRKLENMAKVIGNFSPSMLGVGEIENRKVLEDLVKQPAIAAKRYQIVHFDMRDARGVDVGLLYQPAVFKPFSIRQIPVNDPAEPDFITRDILWVKGLFLGDTLHVAVNHWPSRRGGGSEDKRLLAARTLRKAVDSVLAINSKANIVIMGDLNDDPNNRSVKKILTVPNAAGQDILVNTAEPLFKKGRGTLAFDGTWNLFDQIIISAALADKQGSDYVADSFTIAAFPYMVDTGKYKGMPMRTFRNGVFNPDGFSDHFPVFIRINRGN